MQRNRKRTKNTSDGEVHDYEYLCSMMTQLMKEYFRAHKSITKYISIYGNRYPDIFPLLSGRAALFILHCPIGLYATGLFTNNDFAEIIVR